MNVYQADGAGDVEVPSHRNEVVEDEAPPVKVESKKASTAGEKDISDVVKKWSKK